MEFYASCPEGFESALADELKRLGLSHVRRLKGRATFEGELEQGYRACLWSRLASRVFVVLGRFEAQDADELYDSVYDIAWENIVRPGATIAITARGVTEQLRNTRFSALRAKDALCDRLAETTGRRADVDAADPDVHLLLSLRQRRASISLDLSGDPLFKRLPPAATRAGEGAHVLRPDYAALVLAQVGWTALCERELTADDYENEALPTLVRRLVRRRRPVAGSREIPRPTAPRGPHASAGALRAGSCTTPPCGSSCLPRRASARRQRA